MSDLASLGAAQAVAEIRSGEITCEQLVAACLNRITEREPEVRAFVDLRAADALAFARELDLGTPRADQVLYGAPVAIKEVFDVKGLLCGWGTPIHAERRPASDAPAVARLKRAGAVVVGTTVSTEYAIAAAGPSTNPCDPQRSPGGSSSGSAAAVAAGMVPLALGSQSIGSIVRPATYCGVFGLKPTRGAISTLGGIPLARELDHVGPIARHPEDLALACQVLFDRVPLPDFVSAPSIERVIEVLGPLRGRVQSASHEAVRRAVSVFAQAGIPVITTELPAYLDAIEECVYTLLCRGIAEHHGDDYDRAGELMSQPMRNLVERGRRVSDRTHAGAVTFARCATEELLQLLTPGTVIVTAATDDVAPPLTEGTGSPLLQSLWTVAGLPVLAVPCGDWKGLPIGVQLIAAPAAESLLLRAGQVLESNLRLAS